MAYYIRILGTQDPDIYIDEFIQESAGKDVFNAIKTISTKVAPYACNIVY